MRSDPIIIMNDYVKIIGHNTVLKNVDLVVNAGEICGIIGPNGSGKSMLLKAICGFISPTRGTVSVFGLPVGINGKMAENTGYLIEDPCMISKYSAKKNLEFLKRINGTIDRCRIDEALHEAGLECMGNTPTRKYSLGMRQKLGIAEALLDNPGLVLLDEPSSNLDKESELNFCRLTEKYNASGTTFLIASHKSALINRLCNRVLLCQSGVITEVDRG